MEAFVARSRNNIENNFIFLVDRKDLDSQTTEEFNTSYIENVNVRWTPGKDFKNLRSEAEFQLVPNRKAQNDAIETVKNTDTIQGLE